MRNLTVASGGIMFIAFIGFVGLSAFFYMVAFLSTMVLMYFIIRFIIYRLKKDDIQRLKYRKFSWIAFAVMFVSIGISANTAESEQSDKAETKKIETSAPVVKAEPKEELKVEIELTKDEKAEIARKEEEAKKKAAEEKVAAELKAKQDAEALVKAEEEKKTKEAAAEKDYYSKEVVPQLDGVIGVYDRIWTDIWQPTFEGLANGSVDVYTAYENMKEVEQRYTALGTQISNVNGDKLSKENKKLLNEFKSELSSAASLRRSSGKQAKKMIDKGTFSPSELDKVMTTVGYSDGPMLSAVVSKTTMDMNLGLLDE